MAASAVSSRPQTLRQARRAYQKAGATTRLSERQMRQLERSAELQERADRIREREYRRKANLKKKNEKIEREREARARMDIPSPIKEEVGASQMRLSAFLTVGMQANTRCEGIQNQPILPDCCQMLNEDPPASAQRDSSARSPLQSRSGNEVMEPPFSGKTPEVKPLKTSKAKDPKQLPVKSPARPPNQCPIKPHPKQTSQSSETAHMPPPPLPIPKSISKITPKRMPTPPENAPPKPQPLVDEWAAFLVSNTQIEREISIPETTPPFIKNEPDRASTPCPAPPPLSPSTTKAAKRKPGTEYSLAQTRTQDLQHTMKEIKQEPDGPEHQRITEKEKEKENEEPDFSDDITDIDLEGAVLQVEGKKRAATPNKQEACLLVIQGRENEMKQPTQQMDSFCDDDFYISTQELRDLMD